MTTRWTATAYLTTKAINQGPTHHHSTPYPQETSNHFQFNTTMANPLHLTATGYGIDYQP